MLASSGLAPEFSGDYPKVLCCGVDSLDVNVYVRWPASIWPAFAARMADLKLQASGTAGIRLPGEDFLVLPSGRPMYAWHLQCPDLHLYLGRSHVPHAGNGNVYASVGAALLWQRGGIQGAAAEITQRIAELGGEVDSFKVSRCDIAADLKLVAPLSEDFLKRCSVPANLKNNAHRSGDRLETIYLGGKNSSIRLRIYDKSLELSANPDKIWMQKIWELKDCVNVWRFEYQLRREFLKSVEVDSIDDLEVRLAGIWNYLSYDWYSLRTPGKLNVSRRDVEPIWRSVQVAGAKLGEAVPVHRKRSRSRPSPDWYAPRIGGLLAGLAAATSCDNLEETLEMSEALTRKYWAGRDFADEVQIRRLKRGGDSGTVNEGGVS